MAVGGDTTLGGNVGIGGDSGTETLLVTGSERVTSNLHVGGNLVIDGSFNFSEVIQNITTVNNEVAFSTQLDISNQGTALKVSQFGVGDDQHVALFNAGTEGDAFKIDSSGNSHFYKDVDVSGGVSVDGDLSVGGVINQTGASWSLGGFGPNGTAVIFPYSEDSNIPFSVSQTPVVNCSFDNDTITIQKAVNTSLILVQ